jgi:alpha-soluble NSF attachment protein
MEGSSEFGIKGDLMMQEAEKKLKGSFFGNMMSSKAERYDAACELFKQAANNYKLAKRWEDAAKAYLRCADCEKVNNSSDAAENIVEAANMLRKVNTADAIKYLQEAAREYLNSGRIQNGGRIKKTIAEIYEGDFEYTLAAQNYKEAADLFGMDGEFQDSQINKMLLKVAELNTMKADDKSIEAIEIYQKVAEKYLENKLTAPSARDLFFRAVLLYLTMDDVPGATNALDKFCDLDPTFQTTREHNFAKGVIEALDKKSIQQFSDECYEFNKIIPLDKWKTTVLNRIKAILEKSIKEQYSVI